jgi:hypothetical protein
MPLHVTWRVLLEETSRATQPYQPFWRWNLSAQVKFEFMNLIMMIEVSNCSELCEGGVVMLS